MIVSLATLNCSTFFHGTLAALSSEEPKTNFWAQKWYSTASKAPAHLKRVKKPDYTELGIQMKSYQWVILLNEKPGNQNHSHLKDI